MHYDKCFPSSNGKQFASTSERKKRFKMDMMMMMMMRKTIISNREKSKIH